MVKWELKVKIFKTNQLIGRSYRLRISIQTILFQGWSLENTWGRIRKELKGYNFENTYTRGNGLYTLMDFTKLTEARWTSTDSKISKLLQDISLIRGVSSKLYICFINRQKYHLQRLVEAIKIIILYCLWYQSTRKN